MSEIGETFQALREMSQAKRATNRKESAKLLTKRGIAFVVKNNGAHLIVQGRISVIDFWPGTGLWIDRDTNTTGRGVQKLITFIG